jgi:hypothetical protein
MAEVVVVHGAFHEMWGPFRLGVRWAPSMMDGLWAAGVDVGAATLPGVEGRLCVAFWGDIVRPDPEPAEQVGDDASHGITELAAEFEADGPHALDGMAKSMAAETNRRSMELLARYFTDPAVKDRIHGRLEHHLGPDTRVVVAHSMGTVLAYQVLAARDDLELDLITLGSPLGTPGLVLDQLDPAPVDGKGVWPAAVRRWTNVAAEGDLATLAAPQLAPVFGDAVQDAYVFNGRHPHAIEPYLNSAATGAALAAALDLPCRPG